MTEQTTGMSFSRRNFIKGAAALTATGALVGCAPAKETLAETRRARHGGRFRRPRSTAGACRAQCGQGCYLNVHVRDGRVVRTTAGHFDDGPEFDRICPKGLVAACPRVQLRASAVPHASRGRARRAASSSASAGMRRLPRSPRNGRATRRSSARSPLPCSWAAATPVRSAAAPRKAPSWLAC